MATIMAATSPTIGLRALASPTAIGLAPAGDVVEEFEPAPAEACGPVAPAPDAPAPEPEPAEPVAPAPEEAPAPVVAAGPVAPTPVPTAAGPVPAVPIVPGPEPPVAAPEELRAADGAAPDAPADPVVVAIV